MSLLTTYILLMILTIHFYLLAEITLKLGLQSTEAYFPYIAYAFFRFFYYYVRRSVLFKIHAASKFFVLFLSVIMENYS